MFGKLKRIVGKVSRFVGAGVQHGKRIVGKINTTISGAKHLVGKVARIPGVAQIVGALKEKYPAFARGIDSVEQGVNKVEQYNKFVENILDKVSHHLPPVKHRGR